MKKLVTILALVLLLLAAGPASALPWDGTDEDIWALLGIGEDGEFDGDDPGVDVWGLPGEIHPSPCGGQIVCGDDGSGEVGVGDPSIIVIKFLHGWTIRIHYRQTSSAGASGGADGNPNHSYVPGPGPGDHETEYVQCPGADDPAYDPNDPRCWRA